jgi:hypothetical protein
MWKRSKPGVAAVSLLFLSACWCRSEHGTGPQERCAEVGQALSQKIMQQPALASLADDVRDELARSLSSVGRICLSAPSETTSCNSGDARAPQVDICCRFTQPPQGLLAGLPSRIRIRRDPNPEAPPVVDLELHSALVDLALDQRCQVPTCAADRATARPQIGVKGRLFSAGGSTDIEVTFDLDATLELTCAAPASDAAGP